MVLKTSKNGDRITFLSNSFQCLTVIVMKRFSLMSSLNASFCHYLSSSHKPHREKPGCSFWCPSLGCLRASGSLLYVCVALWKHLLLQEIFIGHRQTKFLLLIISLHITSRLIWNNPSIYYIEETTGGPHSSWSGILPKPPVKQHC